MREQLTLTTTQTQLLARQCPYCKNDINGKATVCDYCHRDVTGISS